MARQETITKQEVQLDEYRIVRRVRIDLTADPPEEVTEAFAVVGYRVTTDSPEDVIRREMEIGPLRGGALTSANSLFTLIEGLAKTEEGITS